MTPAIIYCRYSPRPRAEESESIETQAARCSAYCESQGYTPIVICFDRILSGGRADNRPGLQQAIELACRHKAVLVVYKLDRMARNTRDALDIADVLHKGKADLASATEHIDTRSPMGKAFYAIMAVFAQLEREQTVVRTSDAMRQHQANGRRMSRLDCCPYGWKPDTSGPMIPDRDDPTVMRPARLVEDPAEQAAVERMRQEHEAGSSFREIARILDLAGAPCRGKRWSPSTIRAILARIRSGLAETS